MSTRFSISLNVSDVRAKKFLRDTEALGLTGAVTDVSLVDVYTLEPDFSKDEQKKIEEAFVSAPVQSGVFGDIPEPDSFAEEFNWAILVGYLPGVTDTIGRTAKKTIEDTLDKKLGEHEDVFTAQAYFLSGKLKQEDVETIAYSLHNPLIQYARIRSAKEYKKENGFPIITPNVQLEGNPHVDDVNLWVSDEELEQLGTLGIQNADGSRRGPLALDLDAMKVIRTYFYGKRRHPTDVEIEALAQTWSEHCNHSIFSDPIDDIYEGIYRRYIKGATKEIRKQKGEDDFCVSVFTDNAGAISFDDKYLITHKAETHNSPSALDPYGGAMTGIVGVNRDALGFGLGAKPIMNTYGYCVADPKNSQKLYRDKAKTQPLLPAARILSGIIHGVNGGGNESGIPTPQGFVTFDDRFRGKPLVFVGTVGLMPRMVAGRVMHQKGAQRGDYIVVTGGRVGMDGIHGATFSSVELDSASPATAVQIGDPITQKKMSDAIVKEARNKGLYNSVTDNGAGGISCSVAEMARECGGCRVELETVPLKYEGLAPWQIWISESQERMTFAVPKEKWEEFKALMERHDVEVTHIGKFTDSGKCVVRYNGEVVMNVDMDFLLHDGRPIAFQQTRSYEPIPSLSRGTKKLDFEKVLLDLLKRPNIASFKAISQQYDHEVQASSVTKPLQGKGQVNAHATVSRPVLTSEKGVVLSQGLAPWFSELDPYAMAAYSIDEAVRTAITAGGNPDHLAILDNFCWCSSKDPERLWQLKEAARACYDTAVAYGTPYISGKDSMFNDFKGFDAKGASVKISAPPTLLISAISVMDDHTKAVTLDLKAAGDVLYVLGETKNELAGSEYLTMQTKQAHVLHDGEKVPQVDTDTNKKMYEVFALALDQELIQSGIAITRGGLAVALAKTAIAGGLGVNVDVAEVSKKLDTDEILFSESAGRILVSVRAEDIDAFEELVDSSDRFRIGEVTDDEVITINDAKEEVASLPLEKAFDAYHTNHIPS